MTAFKQVGMVLYLRYQSISCFSASNRSIHFGGFNHVDPNNVTSTVMFPKIP